MHACSLTSYTVYTICVWLNSYHITVQRLYRVTHAYILKFLSSLKKEAHSHERMPQNLTVAETEIVAHGLSIIIVGE